MDIPTCCQHFVQVNTMTIYIHSPTKPNHTNTNSKQIVIISSSIVSVQIVKWMYNALLFYCCLAVAVASVSCTFSKNILSFSLIENCLLRKIIEKKSSHARKNKNVPYFFLFWTKTKHHQHHYHYCYHKTSIPTKPLSRPSQFICSFYQFSLVIF